jgi:hypothetical protein
LEGIDGEARVEVELVEEEVVGWTAMMSYGLRAGSGKSRTLKVTITSALARAAATTTWRSFGEDLG